MTNEKTPIKPENIREGDLIREERNAIAGGVYSAVEYRATRSRISTEGLTYYLLDRPEPPFEPYWGMVITKSPLSVHRAIYSPGYEHDAVPWASTSYQGSEGQGWDWRSNDWAKQKLAEGWKILEKPDWAS